MTRLDAVQRLICGACLPDDRALASCPRDTNRPHEAVALPDRRQHLAAWLELYSNWGQARAWGAGLHWKCRSTIGAGLHR